MSEESFRERATGLAGIILGSIFILISLTAIVTSAAFLHGFVIKVMWGWFVTPLGLPALGYAQAIGLGFFLRYVTWQHNPPVKDNSSDKEIQTRRIVVVFIYPFLILGLGFIAHTFM